MPRAQRGTIRFSYRTSKERFSTSVSIPRWITIPFIMVIGLILWVGVLSDSSGHLTMPGTGSILYVAAVIGVAALLAYADRKRNPPPRNRRDGTGQVRTKGR